MSLPGKLCIGILEEDNPLKSYFRFKPLLLESAGVYEPIDSRDMFPEDGCVRIVPDKNESSHFKARMRRMGLYGMLDLREHPNENDKIRPNKNFNSDQGERNAYIVYSDVILSPPEGMIAEVLTISPPADASHMALSIPTPNTKNVLLRDEEGFSASLWTHEPMASVEGGLSLTKLSASVDISNAQEIKAHGFGDSELDFLIVPPGASLYRLENTAEPVREEAPVVKAVEPAAVPEPEPVLNRVHASPRAQAMALQSGLNPRRGRSLQEIIEDKWRRSRIDQLGHPIPANAMGHPVMSPVEGVLHAARLAWQNEESRPQLIEALTTLDGFGNMAGSRIGEIASEANAARLNELEAQRLKLLNEISMLESRREDSRAAFIAEIHQKNAAAFEEDKKRAAALRAELMDYQKQAAEAKRALDAANEAFNKLTDEQICSRLTDFAMNSCAMQLVEKLRRGNGIKPIERPKLSIPSAGELVSDVRRYFDSAGTRLANDETVNLLACFALNDVLIISGASGTDRSSVGRLLCNALGLTRYGRFKALIRAKEPISRSPEFLELMECPKTEAPLVAMLNDVNASPCDEAMRELLEISEAKLRCELKLIFTVLDNASGCSIRSELLDRGFMVRLSMEPCDSDWRKPKGMPEHPEYAVSLEALRCVFANGGEVLESVAARMEQLRLKLGELGVLLSRRALNDTYTYCAGVTPLMRNTDAMGVLDLAISQRVLPSILAGAPIEALHALPEVFADMPACQKLMKEPLALDI